MLLLLTYIQIILITWLCSGTRAEFGMPMVIVSSLMLMCSLKKIKESKSLFFSFLCYVLWYIIIVGIIQYVNPFCEVLTNERFIVLRELEYYDFLPTSILDEFHNGNAYRSMLEISSVLSVLISCMILFKSRKDMLYVIAFFAINVGVMGIFAIWQKYNMIPIMYNKFHSNSMFYGSFFLSNAATSFFNLGLVASIAMTFLLNKTWNKYYKTINIFFILNAIICFVAIFISDSNAGKILVIATIFCIPIAILFRHILLTYSWRTFSGFVVCFFILIGCIIMSFRHEILHKLTYIDGHKNPIAVSVSSRIHLYKLVKDCIEERPVWGSGGYSCQYVLSSKIANTNKEHELQRSTEHAHSDILEYIMEYGISIFIIILVGFVLYLREIIIRRPNNASLIFTIGILISIIHSCGDMNLHILSTMIASAYVAIAAIYANDVTC